MKRVFRMIVFWSLNIMLLQLLSCATAPETITADSGSRVKREPAFSSNAPGWASKVQFVEGDTHYFVGRSTGQPDKGEGHQLALRDALNLVSRYVKVELRSLLKSYEEAFAGDDASEMVQAASVERGAGITLREYFKDYYSELAYQGGAVLYDSFVKIGISSNDMERIKVQAANVTGWNATVSGSCNFGESEAAHLFKESATRLGWILASKPALKTEIITGTIPIFAYYSEITAVCSENRTVFTVTRYDLIENTIVSSVTASGGSYCDLKKDLFRSMRIDLPVIDFPEYPDIKKEGVFSELESDLVKLYSSALKAEKKGRLFPQKAKSAWAELYDYQGENRFKELAQNRIEFYEKTDELKKTIGDAEEKDRTKLIEIASSGNVDALVYPELLSKYIETYGAYSGRAVIESLIDIISDSEIKEEVRKLVLKKNVNVQSWLSSCLSGNGAKCYLYSLIETEESREYKKRSCLLQVEKGCSELAEDSEKKENGKSVVYFGEKSCHLGNREWCFKSADILYSGKLGLKPDVSKSNPLLIDSCETGEVRGCFYLGFIYERGEGVEKDREKSLKFYKKACELGHAGSCQKK